MRETKHGYNSKTERITIDELNQEDIVKIEEMLSKPRSTFDRDCGIDKDGNNIRELTDYHKREYFVEAIIIVLSVLGIY